MLEPTSPTRRPVEIIRQVDAPPAPTAALVLDSLGRMHPGVAITLVLATVGMTAGTVVAILALVGMIVAGIAAIAGMVALSAMSLGLGAIVLGALLKPSK